MQKATRTPWPPENIIIEQVGFAARISKQGKRSIINIPKAMLEQIDQAGFRDVDLIVRLSRKK